VTPLTDFLQRLLSEGSVVLRERPVTQPAERGAAVAWLRSAFAEYRLDVAGPLLPFDETVALKAAACCRSACWFLVDHSAEDAEVQAEVKMPDPSGDPAQHLSADLVLRFVPQVYHRARAVAVDDVLTRRLAAICRQWPLSGVLADIEQEPTTPLDFGGHPGLQLLYAERFAKHQRPGWLPRGGAEEYINLVLSERGE
jgi:hypothetical protein